MKLQTYSELAMEAPEYIEKKQRDLLAEHIRYCRDCSPYYRERINGEYPLSHAPVCDVLSTLPLTTKEDVALRNDDFFAVDIGEVVDIVLTSGTTGTPTRVVYTEHDLQRLAYNEEQAFTGCGLSRHDIVLLTCTMDRCFIAGLAYFLGARRIGAAAVRNGHGTLESHAEVMHQTRPTAIVGVPSFVKKLGHYLREQGKDPLARSVQRIIAIGEPIRDGRMERLASAREIEDVWGARVYSTYASTETITTFCECTKQCGGHLLPDLALVEILDAEGRALPPGDTGEITVTPLQTEGMPLIRFRTGDMGFLMDEPCSCGRNTPRLSPILGRTSQRLKVQGTTLFPNAIHQVLHEYDAISEYYISASRRDVLADEVCVHVSLRPGAELTAEELERGLQARLRVKPKVRLEAEDRVRQVVFNPKYRKPMRFVLET